MKLICDYRERAIIKKIQQASLTSEYGSVECLSENLFIGDFVIGNIIIERKTHADLASSILDGRYKEQCSRLCEYRDENPGSKIVYFIEGNFDFCMNAHNINKEKLISAIFTLIYEKNFSVILTKHMNETSDFLLKFCKKYYTKYNNTQQSLEHNDLNNDIQNIEHLVKQGTKKSSQINKNNIGVMMLCNVPHVSINVANALLQPFNYNLYDFLTKIQEDKTYLENFKVHGKDGKSRKLSKKIAELLNEFFTSSSDLDLQDLTLS